MNSKLRKLWNKFETKAASITDQEKEILAFERTFMWNLLQIFKQTLTDVDDETNGYFMFCFWNLASWYFHLIKLFNIFHFFFLVLFSSILEFFKMLVLMGYIFWSIACSYLSIWSLFWLQGKSFQLWNAAILLVSHLNIT